MTLSKYEQETIINWNNAEKTCSIMTYDVRLRNQLEKLAENDTDSVETIQHVSYTEYIIPKKWVKVQKPRQLSEEQRSKLKLRAMAHLLHQKQEAPECEDEI